MMDIEEMDLDAFAEIGLTKADVLAIKMFTSGNFDYMNPAVASQRDRVDKKDAQGNKIDWMDSRRANWELQNPPDANDTQATKDAKWEAAKKSMYEEGSLHAAMLLQVTQKLPPQKGDVYRGLRMEAHDFNSTYRVGKVFTFECFASSATSETVARGFAEGKLNKNPKADWSVMLVSHVLDARDIQLLSMAKEEKEWLILPGTKLTVTSIEDEPSSKQTPGKVRPDNPAAVMWKRVTLTQIP
jgi:hypothetical protein